VNNPAVDATRLADLDSTATRIRQTPMSGTALAAGVSGRTQRSSLAIAILLAIATPLFSSGCGVSSATPAVGKSEVTPASLEIDAGVIFADRASYLCLPLSRFGISSSDDIQTIVSSCECVIPSLVRYSDGATTTVDGVLFEFIPSEATLDAKPQSVQLGVVVTFTTVSGENRTVTVTLLHTRALAFGDVLSRIAFVSVSIRSAGFGPKRIAMQKPSGILNYVTISDFA